jgi:hypothetical protein
MMTKRLVGRLTLGQLTTAVLTFGLVGRVCAQDQAAPAEPRFVPVWFEGAIASIYQAEYRRLSSECSGLGDACWVERLDSTAVPIVPAWDEPGATEPVGRLVVRLRTEGQYPYAALLFQGTDGREVTVQADLGDWGYRSILDIRDWRDGFVQPWLLEPVGDYWITGSEESYDFIIGSPFGLEGNLWRFGPVQAVRARAEGAPAPSTSDPAELPLDVYMILEVRDGLVRFRREIPQDMDCEPMESASPSAAMPVYEVPLVRLLHPSGRPLVEFAYPKGC